MRAVEVAAGAAATIAVLGSLGTATPAHASSYGVELNGTYRVISNGDWAKTNEVYIDEKTVVQTWTMTSSCTSPQICTGEVTSDQGWTAPLRLGNGEGPGSLGDFWAVERDVENWEPCPDGTAAPGKQKFLFWGFNPVTSERNLKIVDLLAGKTTTKAPSGACGINRPLVIDVPVRMEKIS
jgi:hypothetical protein